jgi:hypothetical protein
MSFDNWRKRLAGETIKTFLQPQLEDEGYYRRPITELVLGDNGKTNGQKRIIGWEPVAYFIDRGKLCGVIGNRDMAANEVTDEGLWSWVCRHPIKEEWYRAVAERGEPWPDQRVNLAPALVVSPPLDREGFSDTTATNREVIGNNSNAAPVEPHIEHAEAIDNAVRAAEDLKATDETTAAILLGARNRLAELRIAADKAGHKIYDPLREVYVAAQKPWPPMVAKASAMEKKLETRYLTWRADEKKKADAKAAADAYEQRLLDEANERAAQRAIAQGMPEPAPEVPEVSPAATPAPTPVTPTYRAVGQRTTPKEVERWWLDAVDDFDALYNHFKSHPDIQGALKVLAANAIKNGQEVPGTRRHFGLI